MAPAFRYLRPPTRRVGVMVDGRWLWLPEGVMLAAALLAEGQDATHDSLLAGTPRGPFCLMGACFQCVATIDGVQHQRTCRVPVRAGMRVALRAAGMPVRGAPADG